MRFARVISFAAFALSPAPPAWAGRAPSPTADLAGVPLIATESYDPRNEQGRIFKEFFSSIGTMIAGPGTDLAKTVQDKLDNPALRTYFPDAAERARLAKAIAGEAKRRYLANGYSNGTVDAAMKYLTDRLVSTVVERVLQKEGVADPRRAAAWASKIEAPFDRCMGLVVSYLEGSKCSKPLEDDLIKNMGLAMSYELTRQEFGKPAPNADYVKCVRASTPGADDRVRSCALQSVRRSASAFGRARVLSEAKAQLLSGDAASQVASRVMPAFDACLKKAEGRAAFLACGDQLIGAAGAALASAAVLTDPRVDAIYTQPPDRQAAADAASTSFQSCLAENRQNNRRDASGALATDNCVSFVTLETARSVALATLTATVNTELPNAKSADRAAILKTTAARLNACWDSKQPEPTDAACLRGVVKQVALDLANARLKTDLPASPQAPAVRAQVIKSFSACLEQKLPADPIQQEGTDTAAEGCANAAFHQAALGMAEAKVRAALQGELPDDDAADGIVNTLVKKDFSSCLGDQPVPEQIASCSDRLEKGVALRAAEIVIPARVDQFLRQGGGAAAYGLDANGRKALLDGVIATHKQCLKTNATSSDPDTLDASVNACFKGTVRTLSLQLGALAMQKTARDNGLDVTEASFQKTAKTFQDNFGTCLDQKQDAKFTLTDYLANLDTCQASITKSTTAQVAKDELTGTIQQVLGASGQDLQTQLLGDFDACLSKAGEPAAGFDACVENLRSNATLEIAQAGVHQRALKELGIKDLPPEIKALDQQLNACVSGQKKAATDCAVSYVKASTKALGHLILDSQLRPQLGDDNFTRLAPDLAKVEAPFQACVDKAPATLDQKLLGALDACGTKLTEDAMEFMLEHMADTAPPDPAPAPIASIVAEPPPAVDEHQLADMMTRTFLCLNGSLDPADAQALQNLEPGSVEDKLLKLIGTYVSYDLKNADGRYEEVLQQVGDELKAAGPESARRKLLDLLVDKGMADQLLKAMVQRSLDRAAAALPDGKKLPQELAARLTDKATIDAALNDAALAPLRPLLTNGVLQPVLVDGKTLGSSSVLRSFRDVRAQAIDVVLNSSGLGLDDATKAALRAALAAKN